LNQRLSILDPQFDAFADDYERALEQGISATGENKEYFAQARVQWLGQCLVKEQLVPRQVLDFGCGTGTATPYLLGLAGAERLIGLEVSIKSLSVAQRLHGSPKTQFQLSSDFDAPGTVDLAFTNGVFHHIPLSDRSSAVGLIFRALRPGGVFALWENNPWNPGTRYVMWRIPFDRDANPLAAPETRRLLVAGGFEILRTDFLFIFPRALRSFRRLEASLRRWPVGGQYQVLARKVDTSNRDSG
jgi:SAM-dependent methyltransferase